MKKNRIDKTIDPLNPKHFNRYHKSKPSLRKKTNLQAVVMEREMLLSWYRQRETIIAEWGEAKKIDPLLFNSACKCISNYIEAIYTEKFFIIQSPEISPLSDGSLDFSWQLESARMLINFRMENAEVHAYFYGDLQHNKIPIKGNVPAKEIYEHLMKWMQYLK